MTYEEFLALLRELTALDGEKEWVEFKINNEDPETIGEYISAIANSAALHHKDRGFIVWGVENSTHALVGTKFRPSKAKRGNEELENWLQTRLEPRLHFKFHEYKVDDYQVVILEVPAATHTPVRFQHEEYVRIGSYKKKLRDFPEKERVLWALFSPTPFEKEIAAHHVDSDAVLSLLDYPAYFEISHQALPDERQGILERLEAENFIAKTTQNKFNIFNLGAILFAKDLYQFESLSRKIPRVIIYKGNNRVETIREYPSRKGYANGFEDRISFINDKLPANEHIGRALRTEQPMYPEIAIRELVANALVHQDLGAKGAGPMVEIFSDRVEITNSGQPLIDPLRFLDLPPQARNDLLADRMRRLGICEERGSGIDKVFLSVELYQLPPTEFVVTDQHTKVILYAPKQFADMNRADRVRAAYQHAALMKVSNKVMTNSSLRERFKIDKANAAQISRVIAEALDEKMIKRSDPTDTSKRHAKYVPFWA